MGEKQQLKVIELHCFDQLIVGLQIDRSRVPRLQEQHNCKSKSADGPHLHADTNHKCNFASHAKMQGMLRFSCVIASSHKETGPDLVCF